MLVGKVGGIWAAGCGAPNLLAGVFHSLCPMDLRVDLGVFNMVLRVLGRMLGPASVAEELAISMGEAASSRVRVESGRREGGRRRCRVGWETEERNEQEEANPQGRSVSRKQEQERGPRVR